MKRIYAFLLCASHNNARLLPVANFLNKRNEWFKNCRVFLLYFALLISTGNRLYADVALTSSAVPSASFNQGTSNNVVYVTKMVVTTTAVSVNHITFTLSGTYDANDLVTVAVYFNASSPAFTGSSFLGSAPATFTSPHAFSIAISKAMAVGSTGYYIIVANVSSTATDNKTLKINGATTPVVFGFTTAPNIINSQNDAAGTQSIQAGDVTLTSSSVPSGSFDQGTSNDVVYIAKMAVATEPLNVNHITFTLSGTYDANDLVTVAVYFNASSPVFTGSSFLGSAPATFAGPHAFSIAISKAMAVGSTGYYIIVANVSSTATDNKTLKINGATTPVVFGFTTAPNIINSQNDAAGTQSIQAGDVTLTSSSVPSGSFNQGTSNDVVYIAKMVVATEPVNVNHITFTLSGTYDANDLVTVAVYFNASSPAFTGSSFLGSAPAIFAGPHAFSIAISKAMAIGSTGYYIIVANVSSTATDNKTLKINGATTPVVFGFTTAPNIINSQNDAAGTQSIQAGDVTLTSSSVPSGSFNQGTSNDVVYIAKMVAATEPVNVNHITFTLSGTYDSNDLVTVAVYFNAASPAFTGSSFLGSAPAIFAGPHAFSIAISKAMAIGSTGYYIIVANVSSTATDNKTLKINGAITPVVFGFTTAPNIINSQNDAAGTQSIQAGDVTLTSSSVPSGSFNQGTSNDVVYIAKMVVATEPVNVNHITFTLGGTYDANDLVTVAVYFNASSPVFTGSSFLGSAPATFAGPHDFSIAISKAMVVGSTGYYIIVANVNTAATDNKTLKINGATTPVVFGFTTAPNIINSQNDAAGTQSIQAGDITLTSSAVAAGNINQGSSNNVVYVAKMVAATEPVNVNHITFTLSGTHDANDLVTVAVYFNASSPVFTGSSFLGSAPAIFAGPHAYAISISKAMAIGSIGYYIIVVNANSTATINNTVKVNGAATPVIFGFTTAPNIVNSQTDAAGTKTMHAAALMLTSATITSVNVNLEAGKDGVLEVDQRSGINIKQEIEGISIYPNPVLKNGQINLEFQNLRRNTYQLQVFNSLGQQVTKQTIEHGGGTCAHKIALQKMAAGMYLIEITNRYIQLVRKLVVE